MFYFNDCSKSMAPHEQSISLCGVVCVGVGGWHLHTPNCSLLTSMVCVLVYAAVGLSLLAAWRQVLIKHNNNTGRWVMPFRPAWAPAGDVVCVGDLKRGVAVFKDSGAPVGVLSAEPLTAIPSRLAMHSQGLLAAATSSGRVHIFR
jgi:hypothetical protein